MKIPRMRAIGVGVLVTCSLIFGGAVWGMATRLVRLRERDPITLHYFIPLEAPDFDYLGRPVRIETVAPASGPAVLVHYGDAVERLPVLGRDVPGLGPLERHQDWLRALLLAGDDGERADPMLLLREGGPGSRLVVVARGSAPGYEADTWGEAYYKDWVYTFLVFEKGGGFTRFDRTYRELARDPHSWEFGAAMNVTPALHTPAMRSSSPIAYPNYGPVRVAMGSMGWTWPVAGFAALGAVAGMLMVGASFVSRDPRRVAG